MPLHSAVPAQKTCIALLGASARRQWNRDHVLGLPAVESIKLALSIIGTTKQSTTFRALEVREENPRVRITGNKRAMTVGAECLRRGRRGDAWFGICGGRAAARTKLDAQIIIEPVVIILAGGKSRGRLTDAVGFQVLNVIHGANTVPFCVSLALWRGGLSFSRITRAARRARTSAVSPATRSREQWLPKGRC